MADLRRLARRAARVSMREAAVRCRQAITTAMERSGLSRDLSHATDAEFLRRIVLPGAGDPAELLERFRSRAAPAFFPARCDSSTRDALRRHAPEDEADCIEAADRACDDRFDLLGFSDMSFGDPVDWHFDPTTGIRSPRRHWSRIDCLDPAVVGNFKVVAELNRHQHFVTLGRAYAYTGDEKYAAAFVRQITSWMDAFPPKNGVVWESSLEQAFRLISWLWALHFFRESSHLTTDLFARVLRYVYLQAHHIEAHLSTYSSPNTHLTGEALGLFYVGLLLPELRRSQPWLQTGRDILCSRMPLHVLPDGVYFERTTYYHRYTADFYLHYVMLCRLNGLPVSDGMLRSLRGLCDHLVFLGRPDGTTPMIGDDDGGITLPLDARPRNDFRSTLAIAAIVFDDAHYRYAAGKPAAALAWLLGADALERFVAMDSTAPAETSRAFPVGGYYVMRDGWGPDASCLVVDCGPHGILNCGHAHADALAIDAAARGMTLLADPGTLSYTTSPRERSWYRSSQAHSTLSLAGESSAVPAGPFSWESVANGIAEEWIAEAGFDYFRGRHDGYGRLDPPAVHRREILFIKGSYWIIRDVVETDGPHEAELVFQFAPGLQVLPVAGGILAGSEEGQQALLHVSERARALPIENALVSECFGSAKPAARVRFTATSRELVSLLIPAGAGARVNETHTPHASAYMIDFGSHTDTIVFGDGNSWRIADVESDFRWAWLRRDSGGSLEEYIVLAGSVLRLGARRIVTADERLRFAASETRRTQHARRDDGAAVYVAGNWLNVTTCVE